MEIRLASLDEELVFVAAHSELITRVSPGGACACTCGWIGTSWRRHFEDAFLEWVEERRRALRARLLAEEGVARP